MIAIGRFIQMYSDVVLGIDGQQFEDILEHCKDGKGYALDTQLGASDWRAVIVDYESKVLDAIGKPFPQDPREQLWGAIGAVFSSWINPRAITYRRLNNIPAEWGTAVNVQTMVFGNMGETSAAGVAFTRNPSSGARELYGELLVNAQGEDVVAGIRTPQNITETARKAAHSDRPSLEASIPDMFKQFVETTTLLEKHYRDLQDLEFTVERGKLWVLQTRNGKRTAKAALRIAVEMVNEGLISREDAILRVEPSALDQLLHPTLDPKMKPAPIAAGLRASPGAASGEIVFSADLRRKPHSPRRHDLACGGRSARHG
jgi:pyruvate,orthophosphate dikinase